MYGVDYAELNEDVRFGDNQDQEMIEYIADVVSHIEQYDAIHIRYYTDYVPEFRLPERSENGSEG
jgi:hypothetical protein